MTRSNSTHLGPFPYRKIQFLLSAPGFRPCRGASIDQLAQSNQTGNAASLSRDLLAYWMRV